MIERRAYQLVLSSMMVLALQPAQAQPDAPPDDRNISGWTCDTKVKNISGGWTFEENGQLYGALVHWGEELGHFSVSATIENPGSGPMADVPKEMRVYWENRRSSRKDPDRRIEISGPVGWGQADVATFATSDWISSSTSAYAILRVSWGRVVELASRAQSLELTARDRSGAVIETQALPAGVILGARDSIRAALLDMARDSGNFRANKQCRFVADLNPTIVIG